MTNDKLSTRQLAFANAIVEGHPQRKAYEIAGYKITSEQQTDANASRLISNDKVAQYIQQRQQKIQEKSDWTVDRVLKEFHSLFEDTREFESATAARCLENIAKIIGAYKQTDGGTIQYNQFLVQIQNKYGIEEGK